MFRVVDPGGRWITVGGVAFLGCLVALAAMGAPIGDAARLMVGGVALVLFATGLTGFRRVATGVGLPTLLVTIGAIALVAEVVGTVLQLSGVLIGVAICAAIAFVLYASRWRVGDLSLIGLFLTVGLAVAYVVDNAVHDDNGTQADQAVPVLLVPSVGLAFWVMARAAFVPGVTRICLAVGTALVVAATVVVFSVHGPAWAVPGVPAGILLAVGIGGSGIALLRKRPAH